MKLFDRTLWCVAAWAALLPAAQAARPLITDDTGIVEAGACQLETWVQHQRGQTDFWAVPACNPTGNLEIGVGASRVRADGVGTTRGDAQLQAKTVLRPLSAEGWGLALAVGVVRHPADTPYRSDVYLNLPLTVPLVGESLLMHLNAGWVRTQGAGESRRTWGLAGEWRAFERTTLLAETFGQSGGKPFVQVGLRHTLVPDRVQLDFTAGGPARGAAAERWVSFGLRLMTPAFLQ